MSKKDDDINWQLINNSGGANPEDYLTPKQFERYKRNPERFIDIDIDLVMSNKTNNFITHKMNYMERLRELNATQNEFGKAEFHPSVINKIMFIPGYKQQYASKIKIIKGKPVVWDIRTNKAYDEKISKKYIEAENKKYIDEFNLKNYKTLTPYKDIEYLEGIRDLEVYKRGKGNAYYNIRKGFSTSIIGDDGQDSGLTLWDVNWEKELRKREQELLQLKSGTSFEAQELKELKTKSQNYVKPEVKKEEVKVETPTPKKLKKTDLMINMP